MFGLFCPFKALTVLFTLIALGAGGLAVMHARLHHWASAIRDGSLSLVMVVMAGMNVAAHAAPANDGEWSCTARNVLGFSFSVVEDSRARAQAAALEMCERESLTPCFLATCRGPVGGNDQ